MIALDKSEVNVRGDQLGDIWWRGKQWAVTSDGIEALDGTYVAEKHRLLEEIEEWPWPRQLSEKTWCDSDEFATAFMVGLVLHGYSRVDSAKLRRHFDKMARASEE
ncbi:hypothetical protein KHC28_11295 [Ancylobacter sonchi]|uniref:hypothetical protein n=1 Tax=Ancylobacter sonchi TaxID=1937790 RepID=UPI001BD253CC|nr:hypothetical protein [Ancylobacter sonchi]MBS7534243.1 hypothetical protein [Ancylobacter sonchi]